MPFHGVTLEQNAWNTIFDFIIILCGLSKWFPDYFKEISRGHGVIIIFSIQVQDVTDWCFLLSSLYVLCNFLIGVCCNALHAGLTKKIRECVFREKASGTEGPV